MSFQPIGDTAVLCKIAYELYKKGRQVKEAPKDFQALLQELSTFAKLLRQLLEDDHATPGMVRPYMDEVKVQCLDALQDFRPTILKYQRLALSQRGIWLSRIQFVTDRQLIKNCRERLDKCKRDLVLAMAVDTRQATGAMRSRDVSNASTTYPEIESPLLQRLGSTSTDRSFHPEQRLLTSATHEDGDALLQGIQRVITLGLVDEPLSPNKASNSHAQPAYVPVSRQARARNSIDQHNDPDVASSFHILPQAFSRPPLEEEPVPPLPKTPDVPLKSEARSKAPARLSVSSQDQVSDATPSHIRGVADSTRSHSPAANHNDFKSPDLWYLDDIYSDQGKEGLVLPNATQIANIAGRLAMPKEMPQVQARFTVQLKVGKNAVLSSSLLNKAVWWILKSRKCYTSLVASHPNSVHTVQSWDIEISREQALVDLMKSRAIVQFGIDQAASSRVSFTDSQWKKLQDLAIAIKAEIKKQMGKDCDWNQQALLECDLSLEEERIQPLEEYTALPAGLDDLSSPARWITVDKEDGGHNHQEKVLFRTFVNAQIGENRVRRKSSRAPYMLILWSQTGHAEIKVSLINQAGTINLCRNILAEDLERHDDHKRASELDFNFPDHDAVLRFNLAEELDEFLQIPRRFFAVMEHRDPQPGEVLIFRDSLKEFEEGTVAAIRQATSGSTMRPSGKIHNFSEISVFEGITNECWKTTRRLVISSSPDTPSPWCISFWLPLCVQVNVQGCELDLAWSDLSQLQKTDTGDFNPRWSYVFADSPNRVMHLKFESDQTAEEAKSYLLHPFQTFNNPFFRPIGTYAACPDTLGGQDIQIWQLKDMDDREAYYAILTVERQPHATLVSSAYFFYRDFDFVLESPTVKKGLATMPSRLRFPFLRVPHYISTVSNLPYDPTKEKQPPTPEFKDVVKILKEVSFTFNSSQESRHFLKTLIGWDLVRCITADQLTLGGRVSSKTQNNVAIGLWMQINPRDSHRDIRLTARAQDSSATSRWTTVKLVNAGDCLPDSRWTKLSLKGVDVLQGDIIDGNKLDAVDSRTGEPRSRDNAKMTISFANNTSARDIEGAFSSLLNFDSANESMQMVTQPSRARGGDGGTNLGDSHTDRSMVAFR